MAGPCDTLAKAPMIFALDLILVGTEGQPVLVDRQGARSRVLTIMLAREY